MCSCTYTEVVTNLATIAEMRHPGDSIRARRVELGWTQAELAERSAVSQADISRLENGRLDARWSTIHRLSEALETATARPRRSLANGYRVSKPPAVPSKTWSPKGTIGKISRAES